MNEFRRHRGWCPYGRPAGTRRLDIDTDYGAFPVWTWITPPAGVGRPPRAVHGCATPECLGISAELAADLQAWADWQDRHQHPSWQDPNTAEPATDDDWRRWQAHGQVLAQRLADETHAEVVYLWPSEGRDTNCPHCGEGATSDPD